MSKSSMSQSPPPSQPGVVDPLDSMIDFSTYDEGSYQSPSMSPATSKTPFARPVTSVQNTPASLLSTAQPLTGPSHQYDLYKQQTGIVPGALASTLQVNQNNAQITGYQPFDVESYLGMENSFDFNTSPSQHTMGASDIDMDFDSPSEQNLFFGESTVNPNAVGGQEAHGLPSPPVMQSQSNVGRMWPGMHQQAAIAKAQAQQRQQQQIIAQQQQRANQQAKQQRSKAAQPTDPIVEQKITQLLNSMRAKPAPPESHNAPLMNLPRTKKEEEEMDDDERLLASEEGKKLSSKERRQLRNKVSARAFRSRRKEYISQLEAEIAGKVTENGDLRAHNRALIDENKRLSDLTRMLLSSPSFSDFLDRLSSNPSQLPQQTPVEQRREARQPPKDVNPYAAQQQLQQQQQQIGMAMIPEQAMDFSMLSLNNDSFNYQPPRVFAVLETPDVPVTVDTSVLSGKSTNFVGQFFESEDGKVEMPVIEHPIMAEEKPSPPATAVTVNEEFENDPEFALYHGSTPSAKAQEPLDFDTEHLANIDIFGGIESEKVLARYELVDATEEEASAALAMARVQRISDGLEAVCARLEMLTVDI